MEIKQNFPKRETGEGQTKRDVNNRISALLEDGAQLADVVELLGAQEFLKYIKSGKGQSPVAYADLLWTMAAASFPRSPRPTRAAQFCSD